MRTILSLFLFCVPALCVAAEQATGTSLTDIEKITLAIALTDFPIRQGKLEQQVFGKTAKRTFGVSGNNVSVTGRIEPKICQCWILTDPRNTSGFYSVRLTYGNLEGKPEDFPVESIEVMFTSANRLPFVYEIPDSLKALLPDLKASMRKHAQTPREFAEAYVRNLEEAKNVVGNGEQNPDGRESNKK